jgi:hypothetical protein
MFEALRRYAGGLDAGHHRGDGVCEYDARHRREVVHGGEDEEGALELHAKEDDDGEEEGGEHTPGAPSEARWR